jgi:hypothetical protein
MVIRAISTSLVAGVLFVILLLRNSMITRTVYKFAFSLGLAALLAFLLLRHGGPQMDWIEVEVGRGRFAYASALLLALVPLLPFVVLVEAGIAGYRGFASPFRYAALALSIFGVAGLAASFLIPKLIQR